MKSTQLATWVSLFNETTEMVASRVHRDIPTTEDTVRYLFTLNASRHFNPVDQLILEQPHPALPRKQIDLTVLGPPLGPAYVEFKYHRPIPSGQNQNLTQLFGSILADIARLHLCEPEWLRLFVYHAHGGMQGYMERRSDLSLLRKGSMTLDGAFWERQPKSALGQLEKALGTVPELAQIHIDVLEVSTSSGLLGSLVRVGS